MDSAKKIRNSSINVNASLAAYDYLNVEEGCDYNYNLQAMSIEYVSSPNSSNVSSLSSSSCGEPLSDFSELMAQLPIKRGLSKYYKGKSRTFTSLSDVRCVEDLSKGEIPQKKRAHSPLHTPKSNISKKVGKSSCFTSLLS
ncbi:hypothetical protein VNO78_30659 [Psophocarpus tetragonolobus]|uniref:Oxidative stress 3 n=1 Tax=Psophocarpus tetragonolobus TaxID=3891 RepID=A0AAN9RXR6_PSOTE